MRAASDGLVHGLNRRILQRARRPEHDAWLYEDVMLPTMAEYFEGIWRGCSTAMPGRNNYVGSTASGPGSSRIPRLTRAPATSGAGCARSRKCVVSTTLPTAEATWENSRVFGIPAPRSRR